MSGYFKPSSMPKWHIDNNGKVGRCRAQSGMCPFSAELHSSTKSGATNAYQSRMRNRQLPALQRANPGDYNFGTQALPFGNLDPESFRNFLDGITTEVSLQDAIDLKRFYDGSLNSDERRRDVVELFEGQAHPFYGYFPDNGLTSKDIIEYATVTQDGKQIYPLEIKLTAEEKLMLPRKFQKTFLGMSRDQDYLRMSVSAINDKNKEEEMAFSRNLNVPTDAHGAFVRNIKHESTGLNMFYSWDSEIRSRFRLYSFTGKDSMVDSPSPSAFEIAEEDRQILADKFPVIKRIERLRSLRDSGQLDGILNVEKIWSSDSNFKLKGIDTKTLSQFSGSMGAHFDLYDRKEVSRLGLDQTDIKLVADFFKPYPQVAKSWSNSKYDPKTGLAGIPLAGDIYNWQKSH